jgi:NADH-quinone oxidoreductase subunit H
MSPSFLSLADGPSRTFFERLVFGEHGDISLVPWMIYNLVIIAVPVLSLVMLVAMISIWAERRVAGRMQSRLGPNRVGPFGLFQSLADGIKLLFKEDLMPKDADPLLFRLAPYLAFAPVFAAFVAMPFGPDLTYERRLNVGVFYVLAVLSVEIMGVILAGWASNNKWSVYGAMREACQMVSYEIPLGIAIIVAVMAAGTLNMVEMSHLQGGGIHTWLVFRNPFIFLAFGVYFIASLASNKRAPFDLPESESELVAGFHTEYSGLRFSFFFFAEYAAMFIVGGIQTALFLGGWHDPFGFLGYLYHDATADPDNIKTMQLLGVNVLGAGIFILKCSTIIFIQMWLRWTLPRPRIDQVLYACVKVLLPAACVLLLGAALWQLFVNDPSGLTARPWRDYHPFHWSDYAANNWRFSLVAQVILAALGLALAGGVATWVGYAFVTGRGIKQRLTDPSPIDQAPESLVKA